MSLKQRSKTIAKNAFTRMLFAGSLFQLTDGVVILGYHSVDDSGSFLSISPAQLRKHFLYLKKKGFKAMLLRELLADSNSFSFNQYLNFKNSKKEETS